jgi:hypothetical protein
MKLEGIVECTNSQYHADKTHLSSSSLKLLLEDPHKFYEERILGNKVDVSGSFFDEGTLFHALILEPDIVDKEFAFFDGLRKQGTAWEEFKTQNKGRICMSKPQLERCKYWIAAFKRRKAAVGLISGGVAEQSIFTSLQGVNVKIRCDYVNVEKGYIADLKTSGYSVDRDSFRLTIDKYKYQLSAALYCTVAEQFYKKPFDFYFIAVAKREADCQVFKLSKESRHIGDRMVSDALQTYKECMRTGVWRKTYNKELDFGDDYEILDV